MSTRTFELMVYGELIEARITPAYGPFGELLAHATKHGRAWRCYRGDDDVEASTVATKPEAKQRVRQYATEALQAGGGS